KKSSFGLVFFFVCIISTPLENKRQHCKKMHNNLIVNINCIRFFCIAFLSINT
ncbi:unnamed protein product, partial [Brassica rapa subsp. trilocularis]